MRKPFAGAQLNCTHPLARGLVRAFLFNEKSGGRVFDLVNNRVYALGSGISWVPSGLDFGGSSEINIGKVTPSEITVCVIGVQRQGASGGNIWQDVIGNQQWANKQGYIMALQPENTGLLWRILGNSTNVDLSALVTTANRHSYYGTFDGANSRLFIDGILKAGPTAAVMDASTISTIIGNDEVAADGLDGLMDAVYIYNRALSAADIAHLHANPFVIFELPSRAYVDAAGDVNVAATSVSLSLTEYAANINAEINVQAGVDALTLTAYAATVSVSAVTNVSKLMLMGVG